MRILFGCFLFLNSLSVFSADPTILNVNSHDRQFTVKLPANPTTGYQWTVKQYDKALLKLTDSEYLAPKTRLMGAGGVMAYTFSRVKGVTYPKSTTLSFSYARSWEKGKGMMKQVVVNFR